MTVASVLLHWPFLWLIYILMAILVGERFGRWFARHVDIKKDD